LPDRPLSAYEIDRLAERIETLMMEWLVERAGVAVDEVDRERPFAEYGLDSLTAVELSQQLEDWLNVPLTAVIAWNYPTPAALARYLAEQAGGAASAPASSEDQTAEPSDAEFERMLLEIEAMSDSEATAALDELPPEDA
jgi:acyl carrier protein